MKRLAKIFVALALFVGVASPAMAQPWSNTSTKCHPMSMYGQYNYRPSTYGYAPGYYSGVARYGYGYGYTTYSAPAYTSQVFQLPSANYGLNFGANYGPVYTNQQPFGVFPRW